MFFGTIPVFASAVLVFGGAVLVFGGAVLAFGGAVLVFGGAAPESSGAVLGVGAGVFLARFFNLQSLMDYLPRQRSELFHWWTNFRNHAAGAGANLGLTPEEISAAEVLAQAAVDCMSDTNAAVSTLRGCRARERANLRTLEKQMRLLVRNWKARPGFEEKGTGGVLRVRGGTKEFHPGSCKPTLKAVIAGGKIVLKFRKNGADAVNLYTRLNGEAEWTKLAHDSSSPCMDPRPLANPNVPEVREYRAMAVAKDVEIGQPSNIVRIVFGA